MSVEQLIILAVACLSLAMNAVTTYMLWREGQRPEEQLVYLSNLELGTDGDSACRARATPASANPEDLRPENRCSCDCDACSRLHSNGQRNATKVVRQDGHPVAIVRSVNGNLGDCDGDIADVCHFNSNCPFAVRNTRLRNKPDPDAHGVPADGPPGVEDAERRTDHGDAQGHPFHPAHDRLPTGFVIVVEGPRTAAEVIRDLQARLGNAPAQKVRP